MNSENKERHFNELMEGYSGEPIVLIGETHMEESHIEAEEAIIQGLAPEYVAHELYAQRDPEELEGRVERGRYLSLENIKEYFEEEYEDPQVFEDYEGLLDEIADAEDISAGEVETSNLFQFMNFWQSGYVDILDNIHGQLESEMEEYRKWHAEGEEVEYDQDDKIEDLQRTLTAMGSLYDDMAAIDEGYGEVPVIRSVYELDQDGFEVKLKGADVTSGTKDKKDNELRERVMGDRIEEVASEARRPVIGIVGAGHLRGVEENIEGGKLRKLINNLDDSSDVFTINLSEKLGVEDERLKAKKFDLKNRGGLTQDQKEKLARMEEKGELVFDFFSGEPADEK